MRRFKFKGIEKEYCNRVCKNGLKKGEIYSFDFMIGPAFFENVLWYAEKYHEDWEEVFEAENDGWISVDDRLPENEDNLLCIGQSGIIKIASYKGDFYNVIGMKMSTITHWMPLPKPPKK